MWDWDNCGGSGVWIYDVTYGDDNWGAYEFYSVGIDRTLFPYEQLDFSIAGGSSFCDTYVYSAGWQSPAGCWSSQAISCFRLWTPWLIGVDRR